MTPLKETYVRMTDGSFYKYDIFGDLYKLNEFGSWQQVFRNL